MTDPYCMALPSDLDNTSYLYTFNAYPEALYIAEETDADYGTPNNDNIKRAFGKTIKLLRVEHDLSQEQLAERVGVERTFISSVERGMQEPRLTSMKRFANGFDLTLSELLLRVEKLMGSMN